VLLSRLASGDRDALGDLYGALCHQGSVYAASFAALPHLVDIAKHAVDDNLRAEILVLVGSIATSSDDRSDRPIPVEIEAAYGAAARNALPLALSTLNGHLEPATAVYLLQAAAGLNGFSTLGGLLDGFVDEEFCVECPTCARELYIWPTDSGLQTAAEDPVRSPNTARTPIAKGPVPGSAGEPAYRWLLNVGGAAALQAIGDRLPYLFGSGVCPACGGEFVLLDGLAKSAS
jgi:hypothetical protein